MEAREASPSWQSAGGDAPWCQITNQLQWQVVSISRDSLFFSWIRGGDIAFSLSLPSGLTGRAQSVLTGREKHFLQSRPVVE